MKRFFLLTLFVSITFGIYFFIISTIVDAKDKALDEMQSQSNIERIK
jgi:hypothetical protein